MLSHEAPNTYMLAGGLKLSERYESQLGRIIPYIMENEKCLKPPTSMQPPHFMMIQSAYLTSPGGYSSLHLAALTDCPSRLIPSYLPGVHSDGPCRPVRWIFTKRVNNTPAHKQIGS